MNETYYTLSTKSHSLRVGDFVCYTEADGCRLNGFVDRCTRDCDGTPLYNIQVVHTGVTEEALKLIKRNI